MLIDSHVHLDTPAFDEDRNEVIARAQGAGIDLMLEIAGSDIAEGSLDRGLKLAETHDSIYAAIGVHPHEAKIYDETLESELIDLCTHPRVIGWGEIGLDYHYDFSPRDTQVAVFRRQLELASKRNLPVIIHTREAEDDTIAILQGSGAPWRDALFHRFGASGRSGTRAGTPDFVFWRSNIQERRRASRDCVHNSSQPASDRD